MNEHSNINTRPSICEQSVPLENITPVSPNYFGHVVKTGIACGIIVAIAAAIFADLSIAIAGSSIALLCTAVWVFQSLVSNRACQEITPLDSDPTDEGNEVLNLTSQIDLRQGNSKYNSFSQTPSKVKVDQNDDPQTPNKVVFSDTDEDKDENNYKTPESQIRRSRPNEPISSPNLDATDILIKESREMRAKLKK